MESAAFRRQANTDADAFDLGGQRGERRARFHPGPQRAALVMIEAADPGDADFKGRKTE